MHTLHGTHRQNISTEMYLKTIYLLKEENNLDPKPVDLVNELNLSKGTVSEMIKKLSDDKYLEYESYGQIILTKKGLKVAKNVLRKYLVIKKFLKDVLKITDEKIHGEACSLEHGFSDESIAKLNVLNKLLEKNKIP